MPSEPLYNASISGAISGPLNPFNRSLAWEWGNDGDELYIRRDLTTPLLLVKYPKDNIDDYTPLNELRKTEGICEELEVEIALKCGGEPFKGKLKMVEAKYDSELCIIEAPITSVDDMTCMLETWENKINIIDLADIIDIEPYEGEIEIVKIHGQFDGYETQFDDPDENGDLIYPQLDEGIVDDEEFFADPADGWVLLSTQADFIHNDFDTYGPIGQDGIWYVTTEWIRNVSDDGFGPVPLKIINDRHYGDFIELTYEQVLPELPFSNGRLFKEVLEEMIIKQCGDYEVISNFFDINPDGEQPANDAYTVAMDLFTELVIYDLSDIVVDTVVTEQGTVSQFATISEISFKDLWNDIKIMFNLGMDYIDDKLYIEHISFFRRKKGLDLTATEDGVDILIGSYQFEYDKLNIPKREIFEWPIETQDEDFKGLPIIYDDNCVSTDASEKNHKVKFVNTDITTLLTLDEDEIGTDGLVLVHTDSGVVVTTECPITETTKLNGSLSWAFLHENFHMYDRPLGTGIVNGKAEKFLTKPRNKNQTVRIPLCCDQFVSWNPRHLINTQLGWGEVASASYQDNILEVNLKHT